MAHSTAPHCVCCTHSHDVCVRIIFFIPCLMFGQIAWSLGDVLGWLVYLSFFFLCFFCVLACRRICMSAHSAVVCFANDGYMEFPSQIHLRTLFRLASDLPLRWPIVEQQQQQPVEGAHTILGRMAVYFAWNPRTRVAQAVISP